MLGRKDEQVSTGLLGLEMITHWWTQEVVLFVKTHRTEPHRERA